MALLAELVDGWLDLVDAPLGQDGVGVGEAELHLLDLRLSQGASVPPNFVTTPNHAEQLEEDTSSLAPGAIDGEAHQHKVGEVEELLCNFAAMEREGGLPSSGRKALLEMGGIDCPSNRKR